MDHDYLVEKSSSYKITFIVIITLVLIQISQEFSTTATGSFIDCDDTSYLRQLYHSLTHGNLLHLAINLYTFYQLSILETQLGSKNYFILLIAILFLSSGIYLLMNKLLYGNKIVCSVGFSGVLFGLIVWSRFIMNGSFNTTDMKMLLVLLILPTLRNPQISFMGHLSGLLAGLILWPILSNFLLNNA